MFICMPKLKFIIHFFLEILHFKELCNFIGWQHLGPWLEIQSFARYGVGVEISIKILVFTLDYFQEKLMTKFFKKSKKPYFRAMWPFWPFLPKFGQKWIFLEKKFLSVFKCSSYLRSCPKSEKTNMPFLWKMLNWQMDGQTDGRTDRQPWFCRTLCRRGVQLLK